MEIKSLFNDNIVLASGDGTLKDVAEKNRSNLRGADLLGADLRGAGWKNVASCPAGQIGKNWNKGQKAREWQPIYGQQKIRWEYAA